LHCCIVRPNRRRFTTIQRGDFEFEKLNINGEFTVEAGVHVPHTIVCCTNQFIIHGRDVESAIGANVGDAKDKFSNRRLLFGDSRKFWEKPY
jgi:hypothetical protein